MGFTALWALPEPGLLCCIPTTLCGAGASFLASVAAAGLLLLLTTRPGKAVEMPPSASSSSVLLLLIPEVQHPFSSSCQFWCPACPVLPSSARHSLSFLVISAPLCVFCVLCPLFQVQGTACPGDAGVCLCLELCLNKQHRGSWREAQGVFSSNQ